MLNSKQFIYRYREAASNFLTALSLQRKSRSRQLSHQVMSGNIWAALRIALSMMDQPELFQAANIGDLDLLMRAFNLDMWTDKCFWLSISQEPKVLRKEEAANSFIKFFFFPPQSTFTFLRTAQQYMISEKSTMPGRLYKDALEKILVSDVLLVGEGICWKKKKTMEKDGWNWKTFRSETDADLNCQIDQSNSLKMFSAITHIKPM